MTPLRPLAAALALLATPAAVAEKTWAVASFDRVRVEGPVAVRITAGASPAARASAAERDVLDRVTVTLDAGVLVVRVKGERWGGMEAVRAPLATVELATPRLLAVSLFAPVPVTVAGMRGERVELRVTGAGTIAVQGVDASVLTAALVGGGAITLAGRTGEAQLVLNGAGTIDAGTLTAQSLTVQQVGGTTRAAARYTARVTASGGSVTVAGTPLCTVRATGGATVACGPGR